jgi:hypothetical protein
MRRLTATALALALGTGMAWAQTAPPPIPPEKAMKLSEIVAKVEGRDQFRYIDQIDWDEDGYYDIVYFTSDKAKVEIKIDPVTGESRM